MDAMNRMKTEFLSIAGNEKFARVVISAFAAQLNPTVDELDDIKTAVSEAVTNAIIHGYEGAQDGTVVLESVLYPDNSIQIIVRDSGVGIEDVDRAMEPFYTSKPDMERSGMGFTVMESFMDQLHVSSRPGRGTAVTLTKRIDGQPETQE